MASTSTSDKRISGNAVAAGGLMEGTMVQTLAGTVAVETLKAGDRIITRSGACSLRSIRTEAVPSARMICISASALGVEQPDEDMFVSPEQEILIRDWRAKALKSASQAVIRAEDLADGEYIRHAKIHEARIFRLEFDRPVVIYANGTELACAAALETA